MALVLRRLVLQARPSLVRRAPPLLPLLSASAARQPPLKPAVLAQYARLSTAAATAAPHTPPLKVEKIEKAPDALPLKAAASATPPHSLGQDHGAAQSPSQSQGFHGDRKAIVKGGSAENLSPAKLAAPLEDEDDEAAVKAEAAEMSRMAYVDRLRYLTKRYGKVAVGFYFGLSTTDLVLFYAAIKAGVDVQPILDSVFSTLGLDFHHYFSPNMGAFVAAYSIHKVRWGGKG